MWEHRSFWLRGKPRGWDDAWQLGLRAISIQGREVEERPDTYLLLDRADAGLKLRGSSETDFDLKVRHLRTDDWELWEKCIFTTWNALEAARLSTMLGLDAPRFERLEEMSPAAGVDALLSRLGIATTRVIVSKKRLQAGGLDLTSVWPSVVVDSTSLVELVQIELAGRAEPVFSLCVETGAPISLGDDPFPGLNAVHYGYPEFLLRISQSFGSTTR